MNEIDEDDDELNPSPQIQSIVPMCDDYEDEHWNPLGAFYGGQVYFPYIPKTYVLGKVFEVNFAIFNKVHPLAGDWIGLFKDGCRSLGQYVAYQNVPELCGKRWFPIEMSVSFSSEDLPVETGPSELYKFFYVTGNSKVVGVSPSFWFMSDKHDLDGIQQNFNEIGGKQEMTSQPSVASRELIGAVGQGEAASNESCYKLSSSKTGSPSVNHGKKNAARNHCLTNSRCRGCLQYAYDMKVICDKMRDLKIVNTTIAAEKAIAESAAAYTADTLLEENLSLGQQIEQLLQENEKLREEILRQSIFEKSKSNVSQQPENEKAMNANQPKSNFKTETVSKNDIPIALSSFRGSDVICDTAEPQRMSRDEQDFDIPVTIGVKKAMANTHINMLSKMLQSDDGEASVMVDQSEENIRCSLQLSDVVCSQPGEDDSPDAAMHQEVLLLLKGLTDFFNKKNEDMDEAQQPSEGTETGTKPKTRRKCEAAETMRSTSSSTTSFASSTQELVANSASLSKRSLRPKIILEKYNSYCNILPNRLTSCEEILQAHPHFCRLK